MSRIYLETGRPITVLFNSMIDKPASSDTLGLELGPTSIKGAQLIYLKGKTTFVQVFDMPTDVGHAETSERTSPLDLTEEGRMLFRLIDKNLVVTALSTKEVLIRPLEVKLTKLRDVDAVLAFQAEPILPYSTEEALLDRIVLEKTQDATELTLCATKKESLENHLETWQSLHIEPEVVTCVPAALAAFGKFFFPSDAPYFLLHLGVLETVCLLIDKNKLVAAYSSQTHFNQVLEALKKDLGVEELLLEHINSINTSPLAAKLISEWQLEITKIIFALNKQQSAEVSTLLVTGDGGNYPAIVSALCAKVNQKTELPIPTPQFPLSEALLQKYAIPIGMAISAQPKFPDKINFRQEEFAYPNPWKRLKKPLLAYLASVLFLSVAFYLYGNTYLNYREDRLKQEFVDLVANMHKPYAEFEKEYARNFPSENENPAQLALDVKKLTRTGLQNRIDQIEKTIKSIPETFPLQANAPLVSDILVWLRTHPNAVTIDEKAGQPTPLIEIQNFAYTMVKRPEKNRLNDKYQIKVDLEFTSPSPKFAREFHDALIAPNDIIDPKNEVKWNASQGKYHTSFFLKDKTIYPAQKG